MQNFLTRADQEALLARVREHLMPEGRFLFGTRHLSPRNLYEARYPEPQTFTTRDGRQLTVTEQQEYGSQIRYGTGRLPSPGPTGRPPLRGEGFLNTMLAPRSASGRG